jgi:hypothetical protein
VLCWAITLSSGHKSNPSVYNMQQVRIKSCIEKPLLFLAVKL